MQIEADVNNLGRLQLPQLSCCREQVLLSRLARYLWTSDSQFGFKQAHGTEMAIFAFKQTADFLLINTIISRILLLLHISNAHNTIINNDLLTPAWIWHLRWMQLTILMWCSANLLTAWWAEWQRPSTILILPLSIVMHISSLHWWISGRVCYMYKNKNRIIELSFNMSRCD